MYLMVVVQAPTRPACEHDEMPQSHGQAWPPPLANSLCERSKSVLVGGSGAEAVREWGSVPAAVKLSSVPKRWLLQQSRSFCGDCPGKGSE